MLDYEQGSEKDGHAKLRAKTLDLLRLVNASMTDRVIINACEEMV